MKRLTLLTLLLCFGLSVGVTAAQDSTLETNKDLVRRLFEDVVRDGNIAVSSEILSPAYVQYGTAGHDTLAATEVAATLEIADLIAEGDLVGIRVRAEGQPGLYLYRIENNLIVEGWAVNQFEPGMMGEMGAPPANMLPMEQMPSGQMPPFGEMPPVPTDAPVLTPTVVATTDQLEQNKALVALFYSEVFGQGNAAAVEQLVAEDYIQHNPLAGQGRTGLIQFISQFPASPVEIGHIIAEGDKVFVRLGDAENTIVMDIFRLEDGLLQEHWDTVVLPAFPEGMMPPPTPQ